MQPLPSAPASAQTTLSPDDRSSEFRAVEGGPEVRSGTLLLVEAYAAIWLILFGFIWLTHRRQKKLDDRIVEIENALIKARKEAT
jgi:CcmD family protein